MNLYDVRGAREVDKREKDSRLLLRQRYHVLGKMKLAGRPPSSGSLVYMFGLYSAPLYLPRDPGIARQVALALLAIFSGNTKTITKYGVHPYHTIPYHTILYLDTKVRM